MPWCGKYRRVKVSVTASANFLQHQYQSQIQQ